MATSALGRLRRQSFVVPLAYTTQQIFQLRSDFGSANANCDAVVDAADDTDAICAPGTRSIPSSSGTVASIQLDVGDLAAEDAEDAEEGEEGYGDEGDGDGMEDDAEEPRRDEVNAELSQTASRAPSFG